MVLLAGPSSSGKTTTSHRLCLELLSQGKKPVALSLDNWYVDGSLTPRKADGEKDYESVYAIDLKQLEEDITALVMGKEIALPTFNFAEEKREYLGDTLQLEPDGIMVIEGIHALNPELMKDVPQDQMLYDAVMQQTPVTLAHPNSKSAKAFEQITGKLMNMENVGNIKKRGMAAFFSHIVVKKNND